MSVAVVVRDVRAVVAVALSLLGALGALTMPSAASAADTCANTAYRQGTSADLPDCRAYERVSPELKYGPIGFPSGNANRQANAAFPGSWNAVAPDGDAVMYYSWQGFEGSPSGMESTYKSARTPQGWTTANWSPAPTNPHPNIFKGVATISVANDDLTAGLMEGPSAWDPLDQDPLKIDEDHGAYDVYLTRGPEATPIWQSRANDLAPDASDLQFRALTLSQDGERTFFAAKQKLLPETTGDSTSAAELYERVDGVTKLVSVDSHGVSLGTCGAILGSYSFTSDAASAALEVLPMGDTTNVLSRDGQTVFFSAPDPSAASSGDPGCADPTQLYVRRGATTVQASRSRRAVPDPSGTQRAVFQGAAEDGSRVFFQSPEALTDDAPAGTGKMLIYSYEVADDTLRFIAAVGAPGSTQGTIAAISPDGSRVYFVDIASNTLRMYTAAAGVTDLVTFSQATDIARIGDRRGRAIVLSSDGRHLAFQATSDLTGQGGGAQQIYIYDTETRRLTCASCNQDGHTPLGFAFLTASDSSGAMLVMQPTLHTLSDDGSRLVFETEDRLVPQDVNRQGDVYIWEDGRVRLISDGTDVAGSYLLDAGGNLRDIFFSTTAALDPSDKDGGERDMYDAREGGGFAVAPVPTPCAGDACQGLASSASPPSSAASLSITGGGDAQLSRPAKGTLSIGAVKAVRGSAATVKARVSGSGVLTVSGASVGKVSKATTKATTYTTTVRLTTSARRTLTRHRSLKAALTVTFTPRAGRAVTKTITVTFQQPKVGR